ncbi:MAG: hypothetical protein ACT4PV_10415 [Planctomycetaceae bacterium]
MVSARLRRRLLIGIPGALLLLLLAHQVWNGIERRRFEAAVERLRAADARIGPGEFADPFVPDEENAALLLQEGYAWVEGPAQREARPHQFLIPTASWSPECRSEVRADLAAVAP